MRSVTCFGGTCCPHLQGGWRFMWIKCYVWWKCINYTEKLPRLWPIRGMKREGQIFCWFSMRPACRSDCIPSMWPTCKTLAFHSPSQICSTEPNPVNLKMESACSIETMEQTYYVAQCKHPEKPSFYNAHYKNLKTYPKLHVFLFWNVGTKMKENGIFYFWHKGTHQNNEKENMFTYENFQVS